MSRFPSGVRFEYVEAHSSNFTRGTWGKQYIVLHWWDEPARRPTFDGVVSWFRNPTANVSIQYMVEANRITQMIPESAMAWHAGNSHANRHGIGIEVNPRLNAGDYETTAVLVAEIWRRRGRKLPLRRHREFTTTGCPGHLDVARVNRRANEIYNGTTTSTPVSASVLEGEVMTTPKEVWNYRENDFVNDNPNSYGFMLARIHQYLYDVQARIRSNAWGDWLAGRLWRTRGLDYVNENPSTKDNQLARAHQYAMAAAQRSREANEKIDAVADAVAELVGQIDTNTRKALEDKLASIRTESARLSAEEVAAELEVTVKEQED